MMYAPAEGSAAISAALASGCSNIQRSSPPARGQDGIWRPRFRRPRTKIVHAGVGLGLPVRQGYQSGNVSLAGLVVSLVTAVPSAFIT
jgi:hypothetical protein